LLLAGAKRFARIAVSSAFAGCFVDALALRL